MKKIGLRFMRQLKNTQTWRMHVQTFPPRCIKEQPDTMKKWESPYLQSMLRLTKKFRTGLWLTAAALFLCFLLISGSMFCTPSFTIYNKTKGEVVSQVPLSDIIEICYIYR